MVRSLWMELFERGRGFRRINHIREVSEQSAKPVFAQTSAQEGLGLLPVWQCGVQGLAPLPRNGDVPLALVLAGLGMRAQCRRAAMDLRGKLSKDNAIDPR